MRIRKLLLAVLFVTIPASALAVNECCRAEDPCCAGDWPWCPMDANGECTSLAASPSAATAISPSDDLSGPCELQRADARFVAATATRAAAPARSPARPPSPRFQPLRN